MAGLATGGFQVSAPRPLDVPANIGKFSTKDVTETAESSADFARRMLNAAAQYKADQATLGNTAAQQNAAATTAVPVAQATIAKSNVLSQENNPDVAALKGTGATRQASNVLAGENLDAQELALLKTLTPEQYAAYKQTKGFPTAKSTTTTPNAAGGFTTTEASGIKFPNTEPVVTEQSSAASPGPIPIQPSTPGGASPGYVAPGGHFIPTWQIQQKNGVQETYAPLQPITKADGQIYDQYQQFMYNGLGGKSKGSIIEFQHGLPPPGMLDSDYQKHLDSLRAQMQGPQGGSPAGAAQTTSGVSPTPNTEEILAKAQNMALSGKATAELAAKTKNEALLDLAKQASTLDFSGANIDRAAKAVDDYAKAALIPGINPLRALNPVSDTARELTAAKGEFTSSIMKSLQGGGRVTQQEVAFAGSAYPDPTQPEAVQRNNILYLRKFNDIAKQREQYAFQEVLKGTQPAVANDAAIKQFPIPPPPGLATGGTTAPAQGSATAPAAAAAPAQGSYKITATTPAEIKAEALKAKQAGYKSITLPDGTEHVLADGK